ncbi:alcohol dehydrogenase catalytic domain-containing protein [Herbiconiux moechotypicola]|uniref:Zn-dependent alcohol dehydrogenase n=1 Tax=Herbiconiux moechotypicola TaxID=637393 RepID=A0ABN3DZB0_9MICO|nr:alcohol dehydrogenase catalytic domain-containing protein [Herbiconiux moechotypicola]MCS5731179.1 alcohol dehydrogenase catalytic domain-containing protein [Herbiconiux moechotypicola]
MRAAVLHAPHEPLRIEQVDTPDVLLAQEVRVATAAVGLCHSDLHVIDGRVARPMPVVLGHEASGVVTEVGDAVTDVRVGDHVIACFVVYCGACRQCRAGRPAMCQNREATMRPAEAPPRLAQSGREVHQWTNIGGFAEEMVLHRNAVTVIDPRMPLDLAAMLGCAVATGVGSARTVAGVGPGDHVVVIGAGGVGLNVCQGAAGAGAASVIALDRSDERLALAAESFGATHTINTAADSHAAATIHRLTDGGADHVFEAVGVPALVDLGLEAAARGGSVWAVGVFGDDAEIAFPAGHLHSGKGVHGVRAGSLVPRRDLPRLVQDYLAGALELDALAGRRIPLDDIQDGIADLERGVGARTLVVF